MFYVFDLKGFQFESFKPGARREYSRRMQSLNSERIMMRALSWMHSGGDSFTWDSWRRGLMSGRQAELKSSNLMPEIISPHLMVKHTHQWNYSIEVRSPRPIINASLAWHSPSDVTLWTRLAWSKFTVALHIFTAHIHCIYLLDS